MLTEAEAKTKWCPFSTPITAYSDVKCRATDCMAWRWHDARTLNEQGGSAAEYSAPDRRGFCGLAGGPE